MKMTLGIRSNTAPGAVAIAILASLIPGQGCGKANNLLMGRVEASVGHRLVVVTDCYRTSVAPPEKIDDPSGQVTYRFAPCRDAVVVIRGDDLSVNGKSYGHLGPNDGVLIDHGIVSIQPSAGQPAAAK
ncbi:MAG TPA: hypothetical protein VJX67_04065 [Blastocatellia bacterium]|nr:hypothetical protein [Blastocatellia bacterium]